MSKIGNHIVGIQETPDYQFGWESAERGEPAPLWDGDSVRLAAQRMGWDAYHELERSS